MTDPAAWAPRALSVSVPPGERRNPVAVVRLAVGPLELALAVSKLKRTGLTVRSPVVDGGLPAVSADPELWSTIEAAAVKAVLDDPAALRHVLGERFKRPGEPPAGTAEGLPLDGAA